MENFYRFDIYALLILLGVFQGFFISIFLLGKEFNKQKHITFLALLTITSSLSSLEILLSYTGILTKIIFLNDFSEPLNFAIGPLFFLFVYYGLFPNKKILHWPHFVWFSFYLLYQIFYFIQPDAFKYNSYINCYHPGADLLPVIQKISDDPFGIGEVVNQLTFFHYLGYSIAAYYFLVSAYKQQHIPFYSFQSKSINSYRNVLFHFWIIIFGFLFVKIYFGRDLGDYFIASYLALLMYITSYLLIRRKAFFQSKRASVKTKYQKSGLDEDHKNLILQKLEDVMISEKYFASNLASLAELSSKINETSHNVSQVINEKTGRNFFNWIASYRIDEAKNMLTGKDATRFKIEEIAEMVGYNSKASFNKSFKEITGQTPSQFRKKPS